MIQKPFKDVPTTRVGAPDEDDFLFVTATFATVLHALVSARLLRASQLANLTELDRQVSFAVPKMTRTRDAEQLFQVQSLTVDHLKRYLSEELYRRLGCQMWANRTKMWRPSNNGAQPLNFVAQTPMDGKPMMLTCHEDAEKAFPRSRSHSS